MKEQTPNSKEPWIVADREFFKIFFRHGPCWMTKDDFEGGQLGQATRNAIRKRLFVELCAKQEIDFETLETLLTC